MAVKIGSARIDENGKASGGKAGDQTGKEVSTQNWYDQKDAKKAWRVFRAKDPNVAEMIAQNMEWACSNKHIGYDQGQRLTLYNVAKSLGFNCKKVETNCETDCSALVRVCCAYAGIDLPNFRTPTEPNALLNSGAFEEMKGDKYSHESTYLKRGDILVTSKQGHTVVVLTNGPKADTQAPVSTTKSVYVTGGSVNVRSAPGTAGTRILGTVHKGDKLPYQDVTNNVDGREWYLIEFKGRNAWISSKYSKLI